MSIHILPQTVIDKIAAGEVIERPASIVKELIENALDAGATSITVEVREGGISYIRVTDNGKGMSKEDLYLCTEQHATSKLQMAEDLFSIETLGFRGEALSSVVAVADVKISSRQRGALQGYYREIRSGHQFQAGSIGCPVGTTIEVHNVFSSTPVRKQYLQSIQHEYGAVQNVFINYAAIHPSFFFKLVHNDRVVLIAPSTDHEGNIVHLFGKEIASQLIRVENSFEEIIVEGFISKPYYTRSDKRHMHLYVNGRSVEDKTITKAILEPYHRLLHGGRYPFTLLNIRIEPGAIDVNVHPQKREIRIQREDLMHRAVSIAIRASLQSHDLLPETPLAKVSVDTRSQIAVPVKATYRPESGMQQTLESPDLIITAHNQKEVKVIGIMHDCYIVAEDRDGLVLIDQHAADERVNYEMLLSQYEGGGIETQALVQPETIELSAHDSALVDQHTETLRRFGIHIERFGSHTFLLRALPVIVGRQQPLSILHEVLDEIGIRAVVHDIGDRIIARIACRMSIMKGDTLQIQEASRLIRTLYTCTNYNSCAHGRPTMIRITGAEMEKKFKRCGHGYTNRQDIE